MRKPAVVVAVAVSAVLAGGIMVTTSADAETTPDLPSPPSIVLPDMPAIPQLPDGAAVPVSPGPAVPVDPGPGHHGEPADDVGPVRPGGGAAPATPARPVVDDKPAATTQPAAHDEPAAADEPAEKPAVDHRPTKADEPATFAAAHRDVTVSQALSTDPHGPVQQQALDLVNEHRRRGGCDNLTVDRRLIVAANGHAADMARRGYFAHEDTHGDRAGERVEDAGYRWSRYGENIARGQDSVFEVVDGWMHSPEHRENIMDCRLHEVGVGLAFAADRTPYWVQDFATPQ